MGDLTAALTDEPVAHAMARAEAGRFDFLPVRAAPDGPVVGLFRRADALAKPGDLTVGATMEPLSGSNLIGADAPLLDFVFAADTAPCRLVLDRSEIRGLVTLSDLQRLPVRTALFGLFIHLELLLTEVLARDLGEGEALYDRLSEDRAQEARKRWASMKASNMDRHPAEALSFGDKKAIGKQVKVMGLSGKRIYRDLEVIEKDLRDPIAHGLAIAAHPDQAVRVVQAARLVRDWIALCRSALANRHPFAEAAR